MTKKHLTLLLSLGVFLTPCAPSAAVEDPHQPPAAHLTTNGHVVADPWETLASAPLVFEKGGVTRTETLTAAEATALQGAAKELPERFHFLDDRDSPIDITDDDMLRTAQRLKYWTLKYKAAVFNHTNLEAEKNLTSRPEFIKMPDAASETLVADFILDTLSLVASWTPQTEFFQHLDVIGAMLGRCGHHMGDTRLLAYWISQNLVTLAEEDPDEAEKPLAAVFEKLDLDLEEIDEDDSATGAEAIFKTTYAFLKNPIPPWAEKTAIMRALNRIAFAAHTPDFVDQSLQTILAEAPLNTCPGLDAVPTTPGAYALFAHQVLSHFATFSGES